MSLIAWGQFLKKYQLKWKINKLGENKYWRAQMG